MTHKLNIMVDGGMVSATLFPSYVAMMDAARAIRDAAQAKHPAGFVVAQYQVATGKAAPCDWQHGGILS